MSVRGSGTVAPSDARERIAPSAVLFSAPVHAVGEQTFTAHPGFVPVSVAGFANGLIRSAILSFPREQTRVSCPAG